jgi:hypothetical protein
VDKPTGSYSSWENTMCNSLAPIGEKTRLAWHDGYASAKSEWQGLTDEEKSDIDAKSIGIRSAMYLTKAKLKEKNT